MMMFRGWMERLSPVALIALLLMPAATPAAAQEVPYTAIVVEDNVQVRAGAGRAYYVVGELDRGDLVEVEEVIFGWLKVVPPEGVHSYISKAFVDARGEGRRGEVNSNRTRVTAASLEGPGNSYREQTLLNSGAEVRIVDEEGSFYKIEPPAGTFVFLPPGSVRRASDMEAAAEPEEPVTTEETQPAEDAAPVEAPAQRAEPEAEPEASELDADAAAEDAEAEMRADASDDAAPDGEPRAADAAEEADDAQADANDEAAEAVAEAEADAEADADAEQPAEADPATAAADEAQAEVEGDATTEAPREEVDTPAVSEALRAVEQRHLPAFDLPLEEQPFDRMIADYQEVREQNDLPNADQRLVEHRLGILERNQSIAATLIRLAELREASEQTDRELDARQRERDRRRPNYDAVGELLASTVYDGQNLPQLFRVVDPTTGRTLGYVEPGDEVTPRRMLGRVVGIVGDRRLDPGLRLRVFDVRRIDVLESAESE